MFFKMAQLFVYIYALLFKFLGYMTYDMVCKLY